MKVQGQIGIEISTFYYVFFNFPVVELKIKLELLLSSSTPHSLNHNTCDGASDSKLRSVLCTGVQFLLTSG